MFVQSKYPKKFVLSPDKVFTENTVHRRKVFQVGIYNTEEEAARAWDAAAIYIRGQSQKLNFEDSLTMNIPVPA